MNKKYILIAFIFATLTSIAENKPDSIRNVQLGEIEVNSLKETSPQQTPISSTKISTFQINKYQIENIRDLSSIVPNFFIPDYGSAMSTTSYIRGIGSRNSGQSMGLYVDNVPYFEKSTFDFDFYDICQIEVLRGSQGTLYGRNAEGGIVNIYTLSPLNYQGTKLSLTGGNYGSVNAKLAHYAKLSDNFGISASGYYNHDNGFFTNAYTGKAADDLTSEGGRVKLDWKINPKFNAQYAFNLDHVDQGAFPYGKYDLATNTVAQPNFNDTSSYTRTVITNSLFLQYKTKNVVLSSTTSHQYYSDDMRMDLDYSTANNMALEQIQKQNAFNEEINLKSNTKNDYQWSFGATGFIQTIDMNSPLDMKNYHLTIPGFYNTNNKGVAVFHQSTYNNLLVDGLSLTAGLRLDYENVDLDYNTYIDQVPTVKFQGNESVSFTEFLPKMSLKYAWTDRQFVYATASRGYKTGGFNVQMFSDLLTNRMMGGNQNPDVRNTILYKPEYSWNYELGGQCLTFNDHLKTSISLFYINVDNMQLAKIFSSTSGRVITNAGQVESKGLELSMDANLGSGFSVLMNYGYSNATFKNYTDTLKSYSNIGTPVYTPVDYKGKYVPYAPQNTLSLSGTYQHSFKHSIIDGLMATVQYTGIGKIYWTEANDISQNFYSLINTKVAVTKGAFGLELWAKNLFNTEYNAFYFYSGGNFGQAGKPMELGATIKCEF
ncbi:MAG: TonB-dependent receptor [Paludibacter sp.]|nr:TonB-dependent receptor [Paludibacter sp.]